MNKKLLYVVALITWTFPNVYSAEISRMQEEQIRINNLLLSKIKIKATTASDIRNLLDLDAQLGSHDKEGYTPLMIAVIYNRPDIVDTLLEYINRQAYPQGYLDMVDKHGENALMWAKRLKRNFLVDKLTEAYRKAIIQNEQLLLALPESKSNIPQIENDQQATQEMFRIIRSTDKDNIVQQSKALQNLLHRYPRIIDNKDVYGVTALVRAATKGNGKIIQQLLAAGANPNKPTSYGYTALMWGAIEGDKEIIQMLIIAGANTEIQVDGDRMALGKTALDFAKEKRHENIYREGLQEAERYRKSQQVARQNLEQVMIPELAGLTAEYAFQSLTTEDLPSELEAKHQRDLQKAQELTQQIREIKKNKHSSKKNNLTNKCAIQ